MAHVNSMTTPATSVIAPPAVATVPPGDSQSTLYVGDLLPQVTEAELRNFFGSESGVISVKVCLDSLSRASLGYGYVNFRTAKEAQTAMEKLNFSPISGRPCRIMISHRDPTLRKSGKGNVFVKNLNKSLDVKSLYRSFSVLGKILSFKLATDDKGRSKGFGFIHYEDDFIAKRVIDKLNGALFQDRKLYVARFAPKRERNPSGAPQIFNNVFIKNFDDSFTDEKLRELFSPIGPIISAKVMRNEDGTSKRFAFVSFESFSDAAQAVETMNDYQITPELKLFVGRAMKKSERTNMLKAYYESKRQERAAKYQNCNLYIKNLMPSIDDERLEKEFSKFGKITSAKVMKDEKTGNSRGFGFVCFENPQQAKDAIDHMNGTELETKKLFVCVAQLKEVRQAQMMMRFASANEMGMPVFYPSAGARFVLPFQSHGMPVNPYGSMNQMKMPPFPVTQNHRRPMQMQTPDQYMLQSHQMMRMRAPPPGVRPMQAHAKRVPMPSGAQQIQAPRPQGVRPPMHSRDQTGVNYRTDVNSMSKSVMNPPVAPNSSSRPNSVSMVSQQNEISSSTVKTSSVNSEWNEHLRIDVPKLQSMPIEERKKNIGNIIFKIASKNYAEQASKITGVLLASNSDLISKIQDKAAIESEIKGVYDALTKTNSSDSPK